MTTRRTQRGATTAPLTTGELEAIKRHAANPRGGYDNSTYVARMRQLERDVLRLAAEIERRGQVVQETML